MATFSTKASKALSTTAQAMGVRLHINAVLNLIQDTVMSKDPTKCPKWTLRALKEGAEEETILDKLVEGGMSKEQALEHIKECVAHI